MGGFRRTSFVFLRRVVAIPRQVRVFIHLHCQYFVPWYSPSNRDLLQWPLALPNDGLIDIAVQETVSPLTLISQMDIAPQGGQYWSETVSGGISRVERALIPSSIPLPPSFP